MRRTGCKSVTTMSSLNNQSHKHVQQPTRICPWCGWWEHSTGKRPLRFSMSMLCVCINMQSVFITGTTARRKRKQGWLSIAILTSGFFRLKSQRLHHRLEKKWSLLLRSLRCLVQHRTSLDKNLAPNCMKEPGGNRSEGNLWQEAMVIVCKSQQYHKCKGGSQEKIHFSSRVTCTHKRRWLDETKMK